MRKSFHIKSMYSIKMWDNLLCHELYFAYYFPIVHGNNLALEKTSVCLSFWADFIFLHCLLYSFIYLLFALSTSFCFHRYFLIFKFTNDVHFCNAITFAKSTIVFRFLAEFSIFLLCPSISCISFLLLRSICNTYYESYTQ